MPYFSTRGESCVTASQAILYGLAPDGAGGYTIINWTQEHEWEADTSLDNLWPGF